jgi:hypothetical protein
MLELLKSHIGYSETIGGWQWQLHPYGWKDKGKRECEGTWELESTNREDVGETTEAGDATQGKESGQKCPGFSLILPF